MATNNDDGKCIDNAYEWINGQDIATVTFSEQTMITKLRNLAKRFPDECDFYQNPDKSVVGHLPKEWIKLDPGKRAPRKKKSNS